MGTRYLAPDPRSFRTPGTMPKTSAGKKNGGKRLGASSTNPDRVASSKSAASGPSLRSKGTINRLNMYR